MHKGDNFMARPKSNKYDNLKSDIIEYTNTAEYPILKELCYQKHYNYDYVMQLQRNDEELAQSIKELLYKKESYLEREGIKGNIAQTMAVFTLKQLGWKDVVENQIQGEQKIQILNDLPKEEK
jgi:hypothetical protein